MEPRPTLYRIHPVFIVARSAIVERLQAVARHHNPRYALPDFRNYYFLYLRPGRKPADVVRELRERPTVALPTRMSQPGTRAPQGCN